MVAEPDVVRPVADRAPPDVRPFVEAIVVAEEIPPAEDKDATVTTPELDKPAVRIVLALRAPLVEKLTNSPESAVTVPAVVRAATVTAALEEMPTAVTELDVETEPATVIPE